MAAVAAGQPWRGLARLISLSGAGWLWLAIGLGLTVAGHRLGTQLLLAVAFSFTITQLLKGVFRRPRPAARRVSFATDRYAFPSGHAVRVGAIAGALAQMDPDFGIYWLLWALLVALARVARARHYVFDVAGGLLLGALLSVPVAAFFGG